jgi:hypothetical protein
MVLTEKHGERYFLIDGPDTLGKACLKMLNERNDDEWYWNPGEFKVDAELEALDPNTLPERLREQVTREKKTYLRKKREHAEAAAAYKRIEQAIAQEDGLLAFEILESRSDYEYERFELVDFEAPE